MISPTTIFGGAPRVTIIDDTYPAGYMNDETSPGAEDGAYVLAALMNEPNGFFQAAIYQNGETPSETPESAENSQVLDCIRDLTTVPRAPWVYGKLSALSADSWTAASGSVNAEAPVTFAGGSMSIAGTITGSASNGSVATVSRDLASKGVIVGATDDTVNGTILEASSAFGHRAALYYNGSSWSISDPTNTLLNSEESPTITAASEYVEIEFSQSSGLRYGDLWHAFAVNGNNEFDFSCSRVSGKEGRAVRIYFKPRHPVRAIIDFAGAIPAVVAGSSNGVGLVTYNETTKVLTITHSARSGPPNVTLASMDDARYADGVVMRVLATSSTTTTVSLVDNTGLAIALNDAIFNFTREIGGTENAALTASVIIGVTNGFGVIPQTFKELTGFVNIMQAVTK